MRGMERQADPDDCSGVHAEAVADNGEEMDEDEESDDVRAPLPPYVVPA